MNFQSYLPRHSVSLGDKMSWLYSVILFLKNTPPAGLEPAIFGLEVQRVIHYATRAAQEE